MNTITQIENALKAINQANFQTLINHLLHQEGNKFIGAPGAVVGKDKTSKGAPDSFFVNDDKYIFVECTTQERIGKSKSFIEKLADDIDHCFKEASTGIEKEKIEKIILACNEKISAGEHSLLSAKVKSYNPATILELITIQRLAFKLFDHPRLAQEHLAIQMVKGDIFTLDEFLVKSGKGLQPSLLNEFIGRADELNRCVDALGQTDILLLSGGSGVGKSKLAVRILQQYREEGYTPIVIQSSGVPLWDDYGHIFLPGKRHIILFDDANKSISNLNYLLSRLREAETYSAKVIVTSRDYVKKQVCDTLNNYSWQEVLICEFKDAEIEKIIMSALPALKQYPDIKRKIVGLAKGNARLALMATDSVQPGAANNYLDSPVLLYEKYFKNISAEAGVFNKPLNLKTLAIVSFFGVLDRHNEELKLSLSSGFGIDWNDLWSAIMELHHHELLDVYSDEIVKVSDQVMATYAFYKCFIDQSSALLKYSSWINTFIKISPVRITATLVDANNTFGYNYIKGLVTPHLNDVLASFSTDEEQYIFYQFFWYYKGRECLVYMKKWIDALAREPLPKALDFTFEQNDFPHPSRYFELLRYFWNDYSELLRPSIELTLDLLARQPGRLKEVMKFFCNDFLYRTEDRTNGYLRHSILLDVLLDEALPENKMLFANGIFLKTAKLMLGWHFTEAGPVKGNSFTITRFDLFKTVELMKLRERILSRFYQLFDPSDIQCREMLYKICHPDGDIDETIYVDELPVYQKLITHKLDSSQFSHCDFVKSLAAHFKSAGAPYPGNWDLFIESDIMKLSAFLTPIWEYRDDKSIEELEEEKRQEYEQFIQSSDWVEIEKFLLNIESLRRQLEDASLWHVDTAVADIYLAIVKKGKAALEKALRLFFSGRLRFSLPAEVIRFALSSNVLSGEELLRIIDDYEFKGKQYWVSVLLSCLPGDQINAVFFELLIDTFEKSANDIHISRMLDYKKYNASFENYRRGKRELESHNIISYLSAILLPKAVNKPYPFGFRFFAECASFFVNQLALLKAIYWKHYNLNQGFDRNGEELKIILGLDKRFVNESLKNGSISLGFSLSSQVRLEKVNTNVLWEMDEYEEVLEDIILTILELATSISFIERDIGSLFRLKKTDGERTKKVQSLILKLTLKYTNNDKVITALLMVVYHCYEDWFITYFRELLLLRKDIGITRDINFERHGVISGSRVPVIQKSIDLFGGILKMIDSLPGTLDYSAHAAYFEEQITWKTKEIQAEQRRDFTDEFF